MHRFNRADEAIARARSGFEDASQAAGFAPAKSLMETCIAGVEALTASPIGPATKEKPPGHHSGRLL